MSCQQVERHLKRRWARTVNHDKASILNIPLHNKMGGFHFGIEGTATKCKNAVDTATMLPTVEMHYQYQRALSTSRKVSMPALTSAPFLSKICNVEVLDRSKGSKASVQV